MGILRYNYKSEAIGMNTDITITYPSGQYTYYPPDPSEKGIGPFHRAAHQYEKDMKFQTVYVLHGGGDDDSLIHRYTRLEYYADKNNVMTVTAQVKDSFFIDTQYGINYYTYITEELPAVVQSLFASSPKREDNFVLGMAMGGNAALMLAMKRPDLYKACVDLSGGIGCSIDSEYFVSQFNEIRMKKMMSAFGDPDQLAGSAFDIGYYARENKKNKVEVPQLFIGVGEDDFIRDVVRKDRDALLKLGYPLHYEEAPGLGHEWDFWDLYVGKAFNEWLPLKR
jgi:S-formylglutathione hydrolase FrmB